MLKRFIAVAFLSSFPIFADVREVTTMKDVVSAVTHDTLVVLDIDNTLIRPVGFLGSDEWFYFLYRTYEMQHVPEAAIPAKAMAVWNETQNRIRVRAVEAETPELIRRMQEQGIRIMALTARTPDIALRTREQLSSAGIDLTRKSVASGEIVISKEELHSAEGALFDNGILFVGEHNNKGEVLKYFLKKQNVEPTRVIFVDDKPKHTTNVDKVFAALGIPCTAFRYGAADQDVQRFNSVVEEFKTQEDLNLFFLGSLNERHSVQNPAFDAGM